MKDRWRFRSARGRFTIVDDGAAPFQHVAGVTMIAACAHKKEQQMNNTARKPQLGLIHTVGALAPVFTDLARVHLPDWEPFSIVDESLLKNTIRAGKLEIPTMRRLAGHVWAAEDAGAQAVFVTCSSIGPAVDAVRPMCAVPLVRVDLGMVETALGAGRRIGVLATLSTTLGPTADLVTTRAARRGAEIELTSHLCEGAFAALASGDRKTHDALVREGLRSLANRVDVVVLAQASMADAIDQTARDEVGVPVLASPELGIRHLAAVLGGAG